MDDTNWLDYIEHRLKWFNDGIAVYTSKKYARLNLDKHIKTQRTIDKAVNRLVGNKPSLVCLGDAEYKPDSRIRHKHIRCPGTRKIQVFLRKKRNCDILMVDEYNTLQVCGLCDKKFEKSVHKFITEFVWIVNQWQMMILSHPILL